MTDELKRNVYAFVEHINTELQEQEGLLPVAYGRELALEESARFFTLRGTAVTEYQTRGYVFLRICKSTGNIRPCLGDRVIGSVMCNHESRLTEWNECI